MRTEVRFTEHELLQVGIVQLVASTVNVQDGNCTVIFVNVAVTFLACDIVTAQVGVVPVQSPLVQPQNVELI